MLGLLGIATDHDCVAVVKFVKKFYTRTMHIRTQDHNISAKILCIIIQLLW